ncbi:MAG: ornithine cyclodeaminase family protein [Xanthobacteraceae bacterium]|nr:ornithine cyclodeaminase family protein [Xanthobacteraceae bacterium]
MRIVTADDLNRVLTHEALIDALAEAFRADITVPEKIAHFITLPSGSEAKVLLMPAWSNSGERFIGCKLVNVFPENAKRGMPSVLGTYVLMSGDTGETLAVFDGAALTAWRTACASALAARYLAREDASHLLMVGAGALAPHLVRAHRAVRPIARVTLWNRTRSRAVSTAFALSAAGIEPVIADDLEEAVREADIVSCATLSEKPLVLGAWLKKGAHLDLVGAFTLKTREADDNAIRRARVYVDSRATAPKGSGDIAIPLRKKIIGLKDIQGDLFELCRGTRKGRKRKDEITLFKSTGIALEDLAAATLVWNGLK